MTKKLNHSLNVRNKKFDSAMSELEENMKSNKNTIFDKEYVKVKRETFDSMNKVIDESKKIKEIKIRKCLLKDSISQKCCHF